MAPVQIARHRIIGVSFDHMHMGDLLREVAAHPDAVIAGLYDPDPARMTDAAQAFDVPPARIFTDLDACLAQSDATLAILCSAPARHADHVEILARACLDILVEKPFAASVADAQRMIAATQAAGVRLAINWPLAWYPVHNTAKRLLDEGRIGTLREVHFYDGNRGPLFHRADKVVVTADEVAAQKAGSWWYSRAAGGGSLRDYLGYGVTLGTWFLDGAVPVEVTCVVDDPKGLEVDEHSVTICRYAQGLSKFETRWGTFTDPWTQQPQPKCGFVLVGSDGTISSYDYEDHVTIQTREQPAMTPIPVDLLPSGRRSAVEHVLHCVDTGASLAGPLDPALCLIAQRIVDSAVLSAQDKGTVGLVS